MSGGTQATTDLAPEETSLESHSASLCQRCRKIDLEQATAVGNGFLLHPSRKALTESAKTCPACALIERLSSELGNEAEDSDSSVWLKCYRNELADVHIYHAGQLIGGIGLAAWPGSPAHDQGFIRRPASHKVHWDDTTIKKYRALLSECRSNHSACSNTQFLERLLKSKIASEKHDWYPRRLLQIPIDRHDNARLVDGRVQDQYAALSYCWGDGQKLVLTAQNIDKMHQDIEVGHLSQSIRDAVKVCQDLQIPYLWVDALCIIQSGDDDADWYIEGSKMAMIYAGALVTISAMSAKGADEGFLDETSTPTKPVAIPYCLSSAEPTQGFVYLQLPNHHDWMEETGSAEYWALTTISPLSCRAWARQERLFSQRILHFTIGDIWWECPTKLESHTGCVVESTPLGDGTDDTYYRDYISLSILRNIALTNWLMTCHESRRRWQAEISHYSSLALSFKRDRLPAIAGLARVFGMLRQDKSPYIYGLRETDLPQGLLWERDSYVRTRNTYAPSWTWASINGAVVFAWDERQTDLCRKSIRGMALDLWGPACSYLLAADDELDDKDYYRFRFSFPRRDLPVLWDVASSSCSSERSLSTWLEVPSHGLCCLDTDVIPEEPIIVLWLSNASGADKLFVGLMLRVCLSNGSVSHYMRVGLARGYIPDGEGVLVTSSKIEIR